jgi:hypothetical protein
LPALRADRAECIGGGGSLIFGSARSAAALGPTAGDLVLLADARLVGEPDLSGVGSDALLATDLFQAHGLRRAGVQFFDHPRKRSPLAARNGEVIADEMQLPLAQRVPADSLA